MFSKQSQLQENTSLIPRRIAARVQPCEPRRGSLRHLLARSLVGTLLLAAAAWAGAQEHAERISGGEIITLRETGFWPEQVSVRPGRIFLMVKNRTGRAELSLVLKDQAGRPAHTAQVPRRRADWREILVLDPGRYTLTEEQTPGKTCLITVASR